MLTIGCYLADTDMTNGPLAALKGSHNDDLYDLYVCNINFPNSLYRNQGGGTYVEEAALRGVNLSTISEGACFGDYDNDGDQDLYVATVGNVDALYQNQFIETGTPDFVNVTVSAEITEF